MLIQMHNNHVHIKRMGIMPCRNSCLHTTARMLASKCRPLSHLKYKEKCILEGPTQYANHRGEQRRDAGREGTYCIYSPLILLRPLLSQSDGLCPWCLVKYDLEWVHCLPGSSLTLSHQTTSVFRIKTTQHNSIPMMHCCTSVALANSWGGFVISNYWSCMV